MFRTAKPIYVKELSGVMNAFATFAAQVDSLSGAELHICAADLYRVSVNGRFVASGPARTAKGYARMDCIPLDGLVARATFSAFSPAARSPNRRSSHRRTSA